MRRIALRMGYGVVVVIASATLWRVNNQSSSHATQSGRTSTTSTSTTSIAPSTTTSRPHSEPAAQSVRLSPLGTGDLTGFVITLDPGHNGGNAAHPEIINQLVPDGRGLKACDTTGTATVNGFAESTFTFAVANKLAADLRQRGATVILTRSDNAGVGPCVNERASIGNGSDVSLSIHGDGAPPTGKGFAILTPTNVGLSATMTKEGNRLAGIIRRHLENAYFVPSTYLGVDGIQPRSDLAGLNLSTTPKVFLECGNMKNSEDARSMQDPVWRDRLASTLSDALAVFLLSRS